MSKQDISTGSTIFISYSHYSIEHVRRVLALAERLRDDGVDAQLDQYVAGTPPSGWPRWMEDQLDSAQFVLVVCTETYHRRFNGGEEPNKGRGADWEGSSITLELYHARSDTSKFVPVLFKPRDEPFIPRQLSGHTRYLLNSEDNYAKLYAFLTGQPGIVPRKLGPLQTLAREPVEPPTHRLVVERDRDRRCDPRAARGAAGATRRASAPHRQQLHGAGCSSARLGRAASQWADNNNRSPSTALTYGKCLKGADGTHVYHSL